MTIQEFENLFKTHTYKEARDIIRQEIRKMGKPTGAMDSKLDLMSKVVDGIPMVHGKDTEAEEGGEIPEENRDNNGNGEGREPKAEGDSGESSQGKRNGGSESKPEQGDNNGTESSQSQHGEKNGDSEDEVKRQIEKAEAEAKKREEEAKRQREEADALKKKLEELKRKMEEERKRKEENAKKKGKHYKTDELIDTLKTTGIAYLVGPAGTGKSTLAMDACEILFKASRKEDPGNFSKVFAQISFSPDTTSGEMIGRTDINGVFHESEIVRVFRDGGLILFDEIDDADSAMLIKLNTAIANGMIATPNGMVKRSANTYIVCTANTFGTGPDAMYVGRTRLDAATLDRFTLSTIEVDYDTKLEATIANPLSKENRDWLLGFVKKVRKIIKDNKYRRLCSTRFVINATKFLANGKDTKFVEDRFLLGWDKIQQDAVRAAS